jgi:hypothetical protein
MLALCAAVPAVATGCGSAADEAAPPSSPSSTSAAPQPLDLATLPTLEQTRKDLKSATDAIIKEAKKIAPGLRWRDLDVESATSCDPPFEDSPGRAVYLPNRVGDGAVVSEKQWAKIEGAARAAAGKIGAKGFEAVKAAPGDHDVWLLGPARMSIKLAYQRNLVISAYTGCRLEGEKKPGR